MKNVAPVWLNGAFYGEIPEAREIHTSHASARRQKHEAVTQDHKNNFLFRIEQEIRIFLGKPFYPPDLFEHDPNGGMRAVYVGYFERKED